MSCKVKIRPFPNDTEVTCEEAYPHDLHRGTLRDYAHPGSQTTITWLHSDRRSFTGEWAECNEPGCVLPKGHRGEHAF